MIRGYGLINPFIHRLARLVRFGMQGRLLSIAVAGAVILGGTGRAHAQFKIVNPNLQSDLSVSVSAPASAVVFNGFDVTATVAASPPLVATLQWGSSNGTVILDLVGYQVQSVSADPALSCQAYLRAGDWAQVMCSASIPWGTTASVHVSVLPGVGNGNGVGIEGGSYICRPAYTDASVAPSNGDRDWTNNRSIARTTLFGCIP
jgi:hypothetical protein